MGIFSFFKKRKIQKKISEVNHEDTINNSIILENKTNIDKGKTGFPIDILYYYIDQDYEIIGYNDAISNSENSYKEKKKIIIKGRLFQKTEQITLIYKNKLKEIGVQIEILRNQGMLDTLKRLESLKSIYIEHIEKIEEIRKDVKNDNNIPLNIINSYDRGFSKGLSVLTQTFFKKSNYEFD